MEKRTALVTGGNGGIGSAITRRLVREGLHVVVACYPAETDAAKEWYQQHNFNEGNVSILPLDVSDTKQCNEVLEQLIKDRKRIEILVNNAGVTRDSSFRKMSSAQWHDVINVNINSLFNVTHPLFHIMCKEGYGRIINISSINGLKGQFGQVNYSTSKAGVIGFTKALAAEGAKYGVTVNAIAPGYTRTPMVDEINPEVLKSIADEIPLKRLAKPEEIAGVVAFMISDDAGYITGSTVSVNGGLYMH